MFTITAYMNIYPRNRAISSRSAYQREEFNGSVQPIVTSSYDYEIYENPKKCEFRIASTSVITAFITHIPFLVSYSIFRCYIFLENDSNRKRGSQVFGSLLPNIGRASIITKKLYNPHDKTSMWRKGTDLPMDPSRRSLSMSRFRIINVEHSI